MALLSYLLNLTAAKATESGSLERLIANRYDHYELVVTIDMSMRAEHADPENPKIHEFQPAFNLDLVVEESSNADPEKSDQKPETRS